MTNFDFLFISPELLFFIERSQGHTKICQNPLHRDVSSKNMTSVRLWPKKLLTTSAWSSSSGVVPDGVASPHPDPLGDGTVLLHLLGKFSFYAKSFQSGHFLLTYFLSLLEVNQALIA